MFSAFDSVWCIHLPSRERRIAIDLQFAKMGIVAVNYVHAAKPPAGFSVSNMRRNPAAEFGCALSHVKAWVGALASGARRPLFVEDDVTFSDSAELTLECGKCPLPEDWAVLFLGGHPRSPVKKVGDHLVKVGTWSCAEAYSVRSTHLQPLIEYWLDRATKPNGMLDFVLGEYASRTNSFAIYPPVTQQLPGWSEIGQKHDDKRDLIKRGWANNLS